MTLYFLSGVIVGLFLAVLVVLLRDAFKSVDGDIDKSMKEL